VVACERAGVHYAAVTFPTPEIRKGGRRRKPLDAQDWRIPPAPNSALARLDRDLKREYICLMCGREATGDPRPKRCETCGGVLLVSDEYEPRYG